MRSLTRNLILVFVVVVVTSSAGCGGPPRAKGRAEAERDLAAGKLCIRTYGYPSPWSGNYGVRVKEELGVEIVMVAGCVVDEDLLARAQGYNDVMNGEIDRRFGPGALDRIAKAVRADHEREFGPDGKK